MIRFIITRGHEYTVNDVRRAKAAPRIRVMGYDGLLRSRWLRRATYVFSDVDRLNFGDLEIAADLYRQIRARGFAAYNDPARVKTRLPLLRALHAAGLNEFNAYRADEIDDRVRFPAFLRKTRDHRAPLSGLLHSRQELKTAVDAAVADGVPLEHLAAVEYCAEPVRPGVYRKLAAFRLGDAIVPHISVHDAQWLVKYGTLLDGIEDLYHEERRLLESNPYADALRRAFDVAGIDYGRADFGIVNGRVQVYEINTNAHLHAPTPHASPTRRANMQWAWQAYLDALRRIDSPFGRPVRLHDGVQARRVRRNRFMRTRGVP